MLKVPPREVRVVNGCIYRAGEEYPQSEEEKKKHLRQFEENYTLKSPKKGSQK
jgi:hypothetical protein